MSNKNNNRYVGELEKIRDEKKLSRRELSKLSRVGQKSIESYETGANDLNKATFKNILRLACSLECSIEKLLLDGEEETLILYRQAKENNLF